MNEICPTCNGSGGIDVLDYSIGEVVTIPCPDCGESGEIGGRRMTGKERLERIIQMQYDGYTIWDMSEDDLVWLIEQAGRVQELERKIERYRETLEFYANKINYLTFIENGKSNIEHDQGERARQALEGEE